MTEQAGSYLQEQVSNGQPCATADLQGATGWAHTPSASSPVDLSHRERRPGPLASRSGSTGRPEGETFEAMGDHVCDAVLEEDAGVMTSPEERVQAENERAADEDSTTKPGKLRKINQRGLSSGRKRRLSEG